MPESRDALAALSRFFVGDGTFADTLQRVSELTVEAIAPADLAGITMMVEGKVRTGVFTHLAAPEIDEAQYATGEGPCLEAYRQGKVFGVASTVEPGPWPAFREAAAAHGVLSTLSLPMVIGDQTLGAMNLYSYTDDGFDADDQDEALLFAEAAAAVLANAQAYWDARDLSANLTTSMASRAAIEQAKGMLMAAQGISPEDAFDLLVQASQRENVKLRDLAQRMVDQAPRRRRPSPRQ